MHLGAQEVTTWKIVQGIVARYSESATNNIFLSGYAPALRSTLIGPVPVAIQQAIEYLLARDNDLTLLINTKILWVTADIRLKFRPRKFSIF
jgi:hypothetical protein